MLSGETIIYFGPEPWKGLWRNRHQLMSRFAEHNDVYYVEPPTNIRDCLKPGRPGKLFTRDASGVTIIHGVRWLPLTGRPPFRNLSIRLFLAAVALVTGTVFRRRPIVWYSRPQMIDYVGMFKARHKIYHVVDEYSGYGHPSTSEVSDPNARELRMLRSVDTVVVVTQSLYDDKSPHNADTHIVANAVDFEAYADDYVARPYELADIDGPVIGYSGLVAARLDLAMLYQAATRRPDWNFVFVGTVNESYCKSDMRRLRDLPNVHMLGTKTVDEVPHYVHHFDVCMIPYVLNLRAAHSSPLKLYEYAAASKPIVSTDFPAARAFEGQVRFAGDADELIAECDAALKLDASSDEIIDNRRVASENTWEHRVQQLSEILGHAPRHEGAAERPHILYVAEFSTGGSIESLLTLIGGLDKEAFKPSVLFYAMPDGEICRRVEEAGANVLSIYPRGSSKGGIRHLRKRNLQSRVKDLFGSRVEYAYASLKYAFHYLRFRVPTYKAIREQLEKIRPDLVHFNSTVVSDTPGIQAARACGIPAVSHVRNFGNVTYLSVLITRSVKSFICISNAVKDHLVGCGVNEDQCVVVPNAVDLQRFSERDSPETPVRKEFGWRKTDKVIALVGRIVAWKGQDYFIRAIAKARETDASIRGLIVGDDSGSLDGPGYMAGLESLIEELGAGESIRFSGHRSDVAEIMKSSDVVVCASSTPEPFGRVIIESMAVGTPVIATDAGGATDIIEDGANGVLVPIRDDASMADAVLRLTQDSDFSDKVRSAGLQSVADRYTVARHVERVSRIYRDVLKLEQP